MNESTNLPLTGAAGSLSDFEDVVSRLRADVHKVTDLQSQALSGVAQTLTGLRSSLERYETHREKTWQSYIEEQTHGKRTLR